MKQLFNQYKKIIIPCLGVVLFMMTGMLAMFATSPEAPKVNETQIQTQTQSQNSQVQGVPESKPQPVPESSQTQTQTQNQNQSHEDWFVYVTGAVKNPGVYKLPDNPRVFHAIEAAGGMTAKADRNSLNLAQKILTDGLHIHIEEIEERKQREAREAKLARELRESARGNITQSQHVTTVRLPGVQVNNVKTQTQKQNQSQNAGSNLVDVNHASEQELTRLKGVGPAIAKRIIDFRNNMGSFKSPEDLLQVRGIGPKTLEKMRPQILIR